MRWPTVVNFDLFRGLRPFCGLCLIGTTHATTGMRDCATKLYLYLHLHLHHLSLIVNREPGFSSSSFSSQHPEPFQCTSFHDGVEPPSCTDSEATPIRIDTRMDTSDASSYGHTRPLSDSRAFHNQRLASDRRPASVHCHSFTAHPTCLCTAANIRTCDLQSHEIGAEGEWRD